jgi:hypothetical protein
MEMQGSLILEDCERGIVLMAASVPITTEESGAVTMRRAGMLLLACAGALCMWMVPLGKALPAEVTARHWSTAWIGLDAMEACGLAATGILTLKRDTHVGAMGGATAALLTLDAWFDITTAPMGPDYLLALLLGLGVELPLAAVCGLLAWNGPRRFTVPDPSTSGSGTAE